MQKTHPEITPELFAAVRPEVQQQLVRQWLDQQTGVRTNAAGSASPNVPSVGEQIVEGIKDVPRGIAATAKTAAPLFGLPGPPVEETAKNIVQGVGNNLAGTFLQPTPSDSAYYANGGVDATMAKTGLPPNLGPTQSEGDFRRAAMKTAGAATMATGLPGSMVAGGAMQNPDEPFRGMTSGAIFGAAPALAANAPAAAQYFTKPARALRQAQTALEGTPMGKLLAERGLLKQFPEKEAIATPADLATNQTGNAGPLQELLGRAGGKYPPLKAKLETMAEQRSPEIANPRLIEDIQQQVGDPSADAIRTGLEQERTAYNNAAFGPLRAETKTVPMGKNPPRTIGDAVLDPSANPEAVAALQEALRTNRAFAQNYAGKIAKQTWTPQDLERPIPGTGTQYHPISEILKNPEMEPLLSDELKTALQTGGQAKFGDLIDVYQNTSHRISTMMRVDRPTAFKLIPLRDALGDAMAAEDPAFAQANAGSARLARQETAFEKGYDAFHEGDVAKWQRLAKEDPSAAANPSAFQAGTKAAAYEKLKGSGDVTGALRPSATDKQAMLALGFPEQQLRPIVQAGNIERGLASQPTASGGSAGRGQTPYLSTKPLVMAAKAAQYAAKPWMARSTAQGLDALLAGQGPEALDAFLAKLQKPGGFQSGAPAAERAAALAAMLSAQRGDSTP